MSLPVTRTVRRVAASLVSLIIVASLFAGGSTPGQAVQGQQGLQGGWAIDDKGSASFAQGPHTQFPLIQSAGAGWVRINFRLGACFSSWTATGCNGGTALKAYDEVVALAQSRNLRVLGLISHESWRGTQSKWTANNAETTGGSGDNPYIRDFAQNAAGVLARHFAGRVEQWEIWNEPNAWTSLDNRGNPTGGTYIYPSNFAWLLKRSHAAIKAAQPSAVVISGGVFAHDAGGATATIIEDGQPRQVTKHGQSAGAAAQRGGGTPPPAVACPATLASGGDYLCATYDQGTRKAGWKAGAYPLDQIGQHLYIDQGGVTSQAKILSYVQDLLAASAAYEGANSPKSIHVTEIGWTTASVAPDIQAANVRTAYAAFRSTAVVGRAYWFSIQDVPVAGLFYGLVDEAQTRKPSFTAYQEAAIY